jgi:hypothetical protein
MKQLARRASLVVVPLLVAPVGTVSAECSLILPPKDDGQAAQTWTPIRGSRTKCVEAARKARKILLEAAIRESGIVYPLPHCACLPDLADTFDPRGAKYGQ